MKKIRQWFMALTLILSVLSDASAHMSAAQIDWKPETLFLSYNQPSQKQADKAAAQGCRDLAKKARLKAQNCKVFHRSKGIGWEAVVCAVSRNDCAISSGYEDEDSAARAARETCVTAYGTACGDTATTVLDEVFNNPANVTLRPGANCSPPPGKVLHYEDFCQNGDCVRHFENGCERRFQAPYCFNPFKNKFEFMPDGCP
jgi:hypothetical protein